MKVLLMFLIVVIPYGIVQHFYIKWTNGTYEPENAKNDDYVDESFKMNFIANKVKEAESKKL